ncbi:MAG: hypothetical protein KDD25_09500 [Bdellovibrionales bacterium]|nr:hypothetical protein [Bdellovibrionales bacterium]
MKALKFLPIFLFSVCAFAADSKQGGSTQIMTPAFGQRSMYVELSGSQLNGFVIQRSSSESVTLKTVVHYNRDSEKIGALTHARNMSIVEVKGRPQKDRRGRHMIDRNNIFEVRGTLKDPRVLCREFDGRGNVFGACTQVVLTIPTWAKFEVEENTTQVIDQNINRVSVVVYDLDQKPLPPPPVPTPGNCTPVNVEDIRNLKGILNDLWTSDLFKMDYLDKFIDSKCNSI